MKVTLPDGSPLELPDGATGADAAKAIGAGLARVAFELSLREGFDLAPCETLWKRTPVVGRGDGGLRLTVRDGVDGFLAADPGQLAERLVELVRDPGLAAEMGRAGRELVKERFLVTAALERELKALAGSVEGR